MVRQDQRHCTLQLGVGFRVVPRAVPDPRAGMRMHLCQALELKPAQVFTGLAHRIRRDFKVIGE